jgi:hypothetical protein
MAVQQLNSQHLVGIKTPASWRGLISNLSASKGVVSAADPEFSDAHLGVEEKFENNF